MSLKNKIVIGEITKRNGNRMSEQKPSPKSRYEQGYFPTQNSSSYQGDKPPIYRSSLELRFMKWIETSSVTSWDSEPFAIVYAKIVDGVKKQGNYYIDFVMTLNGKEFLVEVKPFAQTKKGGRDWEINKRKWNSAIEYCNKNGKKFIIVTENFPPLKNIK